MAGGGDADVRAPIGREPDALHLRHVEELDVEHQRRVRREHAPGAARTISELGGNDQRSLAAHLHSGNTLIPSRNHLTGSELELKRIVAIAGAVELLSLTIRRGAVVQPPGVMNRYALPPGRLGARAH